MSDETDKEFKSIAGMLRVAEKEGLLVEVVWSFANGMSSGDRDIPQAAQEALHEWDI